MGLEATCKVSLGGRESVGKAHCGDGEIDFKGDFRFRWKWAELSTIRAVDGVLSISRNGEHAHFHLGMSAQKWLDSIKNPKGRLDKLGLKPGHKYQAWGEFDEAFERELLNRAGEPGDAPLDAVFVRMDSGEDLPNLLKAKSQIANNGMIWAIWPKGRREFREDDIRAYALQNGLVDVKVASFSETLSALKLVIPVALRGG